MLRYTPSVGFVGIDRFTYAITDQQGLTSNETNVEVMVLDFSAPLPFRNTRSPLDVNGDGIVSPVDALLVINQLNNRADVALPTTISQARGIFGYVDVNGSGTLEPLDVLLVINGLNNNSSGEGERSNVEQSLAPDWLSLKRQNK